MHARAAHPTRLRQPMKRWGRACVWLLALGVALQGSVIAMTRAAEPAHVHAGAAAERDRDRDRERDPMLDGVRVVQNHHGAGQHHHAEVERHAHDTHHGDMIYVDGDAAGGDAVKSGNAKRVSADLNTPTASVSLPTALPLPGDGCPAPSCDYTSHVGARLERPPR